MNYIQNEKRAVDTLRVMSAEVISHANSGHSGIALGAAPIMYAMYKAMNVDPSRPDWFNRDRFVFSAGHGSALLYSAMHMFGFPISKEELKTFRKYGSRLHGHPEVLPELGIDASAGPLGQGIGMAVGIALAEKELAYRYNKGLSVVDHYTYCIAGDGCLMEGVAYEACAFAGLWKLNKLIMLYDANEVTLDGPRGMSDKEDTAMRFRACGWNVIEVANANEAAPISAAIGQAKRSDKPTLIICRTSIGYGASAEGTHKAHGQVLKAEECAELRKKWGLTQEFFGIDADVMSHFKVIEKEKIGLHAQWTNDIEIYAKKNPKEWAELEQFITKTEGNKKTKRTFNVVAEGKSAALRMVGQAMLRQVAAQSPRVWGGSADVASTTMAFVGERDLAFGVREHGMAAICNGLALHGFLPYCSAFLAFSDYLKPSLRLSALMNTPVHYIFTHDGFGNPPDGPTHQANEHISALRLVPSFHVFRPANDYEVAAVYKYVYEKEIPAASVLSRGGEFGSYLGECVKADMATIEKGAYVIYETKGLKPSVILLATGAEVGLSVESAKVLEQSGVGVRVVSMPCEKLFAGQDRVYRESVIVKNLPVVAIEMGTGDMWHKYVNVKDGKGAIISFEEFGHSSSESDMRKSVGFTVENIAQVVKDILK